MKTKTDPQLSTKSKKSDEIDIKHIMQHIHQEIARKKKEGIYSKDLENHVNILLKSAQEKDELTGALDQLVRHSHIKHDLLLPSTRPVIGSFITLSKKIIRKLTAWYFKSITEQINFQNNKVIAAFNIVQKRIDALDRQVGVLNTKVDFLSKRNEMLLFPGKSKLWQDNYTEFAEKFEHKKDNYQKYVKYFQGKNKVLDIGCGQGLFLDVLQTNNVKAIGIDINPSMIEKCLTKEHSVVQQDALDYIQRAPNDTYDGLIMSNLIEYLSPNYLCELLTCCYQKLVLDSYLVIASTNPADPDVNLESRRNITMHKLIHPETIIFLLESLGFKDIEFEFTSKKANYFVAAKKPAR